MNYPGCCPLHAPNVFRYSTHSSQPLR